MGCSPHLCKESTPMGHGIALTSADVSVEARLSHGSFVIMNWNFGWVCNSLLFLIVTERKTSIFPASKFCIITRKIKKVYVQSLELIFVYELWKMYHLGPFENHTLPPHSFLLTLDLDPFFVGVVLKGWWVWYPLMLPSVPVKNVDNGDMLCFCSKTWSLVPHGFWLGTMGGSSHVELWACRPKIALQRKSIGLLFWKDGRSFPSWFWRSLKFKVSHHIPKKTAEVAKQSRSNIMWWELLCFFGRQLFVHCFVLQLHLVVGNGFWGAEKVFKKQATVDPMWFLFKVQCC